MIKLIEKNGAVVFSVRIVPRASHSAIVGAHDGALKIRIAAPPVDGAANEELVKLLSKTFAVPKNDVEILAGKTSRTKQIKLSNVNVEKFREAVE